MRVGDQPTSINHFFDPADAGGGTAPKRAETTSGGSPPVGDGDVERTKRGSATPRQLPTSGGSTSTTRADRLTRTSNADATGGTARAKRPKGDATPKPVRTSSTTSPTGFFGRIGGFFGSLAHALRDLPMGIAHSLYTFASDTVHGRVERSVRDLLLISISTPLSLGAHVLGAFVQLFNGGARSLNARETNFLKATYGRDFDTSELRLVERGGLLNGAFKFKNSALTLGNTVYVDRDSYSETDDKYLVLLAHEATHTVQYARRGNEYLIDALASEATKDGYDFVTRAARGVPFDRLNLEQQAAVFESIAHAKFTGAPGEHLYVSIARPAKNAPSTLTPVTGGAVAVTATKDVKPAERQVDVTALARSALASRAQGAAWASRGFFPNDD